MLTALLIDRELDSIQALSQKLSRFYPSINICGICSRIDQAYDLAVTTHPEILFIEAKTSQNSSSGFITQYFYNNYEVIITASEADYAIQAIRHQVCGYLLKPIQDDELTQAVENAIKRRKQRERIKQDSNLLKKVIQRFPPHQVIGVPTMEGLEFILINDIIRCEGLQKCTRVITKNQVDTISSYNIGEFKKILEPFGFFTPHKSHLINLRFIRKYRREGTVTMLDNSHVPVARRRKSAFLEKLLHI